MIDPRVGAERTTGAGTPGATLEAIMPRSRALVSASAAAFLTSSLALAAPKASPSKAEALPPLPAATGSAARDGAAELRRGIVQVERAGRPMAVGTVLAKDGRVLTSLSALGATEQPELRYADDTVVPAKIGHKDAAWDLALLVPQSGRWLEGLAPTPTDPAGREIKALVPKAGKLAAATVGLKGRTDAQAKGGEALRSALAVDLRGLAAAPGSPLVDPDGKVVGLLVRACKASGAAKGQPACAPVTVGAPVHALRSFLTRTPASAVAPAPWLGLGGVSSKDVRGVRVVGVAPGSPAEEAKLSTAVEAPDTIVAVDGRPIETPEQLADLIAKRGVGDTVTLLVHRDGTFREVAVVLRPLPARPPSGPVSAGGEAGAARVGSD